MCGRSRSPRAAVAGTVLLLGNEAALAGAKLSGWRILVAANMEQARQLLARGDIAVVLCELGAVRMDWKGALRLLAATPSHPSILLMTPAGKRPAWSEVAAAGGYDLVSEPPDAELLDRTLRSARVHWRSRRALESTPAAQPRR